MSETIRYEVMVNSQSPRYLELLESMNTPDGFALRLPVEPPPASILNEWNNIHLVGEIGEDRFAELVGGPVEPDPFYPVSMSPHQHERWTSEKFAAFVLSRRRLRLPWLIDGQPAPTLAALAAYLMTPMLVRYHLNGVQRLVFITAFGEITHAEYAGDEEALSMLKGRFLGGSLGMGLREPGVEVLAGPADPHPLETVAGLRMDQLADWRGDRRRGMAPDLPGGGLTPDSLQATDPGKLDIRRLVIASAEYSGRLYELLVPPVGEYGPLDVLCTVDGVLQNYTDPETGLASGHGAWVSDWADWILQDAAPAPAPAQSGRTWEADGPEADMYRVEHNIVTYAEHETDVARFASADELQAWVDRSLGNHNARYSVRLLDDLSLVLTDCLQPYQRVDFDRSGAGVPDVRVAARRFSPWDGVENWLDDEGGYSRCPVVRTAVDGQVLETFSAVNCLDDNWLNNDMLPPGAPAGENSWYVMHLEGTESAITFPARGTMLTIATDHDGASATVVAREASERLKEHGREYAFEQQWDRWLNDERQLTKEEIAAGLETIRSLIEEARA